MDHKKFKLSHSILILAALLVGEWLALVALQSAGAQASVQWSVILATALFGGAASIVFATQIIEEVRNAMHMLTLLCAVVFEFIIYFAFQYFFLARVLPGSFAGLGADAVSLILHSTMIFVFNPIYQPTTFAARALMLLNTLESLGLVLFILQNVSQFRHANRAEA